MFLDEGYDATADLQKQKTKSKKKKYYLMKRPFQDCAKLSVCISPKEEESSVKTPLSDQRGKHPFSWALRVNKEQLEQTCHAGLAGEAAGGEATQEQEQI